MNRSNYKTLLLSLMTLLLLLVVFSAQIGTVKIPIPETIKIFTGSMGRTSLTSSQQTYHSVITQIRLPRILAAILCGAALSVSGAAFQGMFMNPLVSPALLGVLAGAAFGSAIGLLWGQSFVIAQVWAIICGLLAVSFALILAGFFPGHKLIMLIMGGVISSSFFTSLLSVIKFVADTQNELPVIVYWLMGGFSAVTIETIQILGPFILAGILVLIGMSGYLNILSMGDEEATSLGVQVNITRNFLIFVSTIICAMTVALGGMIGWVGLMIPHIARMITGPDNRKLLPVAALIGACYLLVVDNFCRAAFSTEIPIGIITSLLGVPFFVFVLAKTGKRWN